MAELSEDFVGFSTRNLPFAPTCDFDTDEIFE